ncbi:MAG: hypothetical protein ABIU09_07085, partial [Pyrinomonadaceae bacterium]
YNGIVLILVIIQQSMNEHSIKAKVAEGGRIVIPAKMREALGIRIGENVTPTLKDGALEITTRDEAFRRIEEIMKPTSNPEDRLSLNR